ncbi:MAG: hypothetical protein H7Z10_02270 [Gemmatimonadaceae bacterium]|nr:hypothetical protein [Acetobacteraceae bacterium]
MIKTVLFAAIAATALSLPAMAQEGNGEPFPFRSTSGTTIVTQAPGFDVGSNAYPDVVGRAGSNVSVANIGIVPETGSEQPIQTANSLPGNFGVGMPAYAHLYKGQPSNLLASRR